MATENRINWAFQIWLFVAVILTFALHEAGHWGVGELLGHETYYTLNSAGVRGEVPDDHRLLITAGGPAVTALQALLALAMVLARESLAAYAVLYAAAFMRFMAAVITIINPNDEARLSLAFGWGTWILPVVTVLAMVGLVWIGARHLGVSWKTNLVAYVVATLAVSAVVGADMLLKA